MQNVGIEGEWGIEVAYKVLVSPEFSLKGEEMLKKQGFCVVKRSGRENDTPALIRDLVGCDALIVNNRETINREVLKSTDSLKVVARTGVGYENVDIDTAAEMGIYVTNAPFANTQSVAEHTLFLIMSCARNARIIRDILMTDRFRSSIDTKATELEGACLGIVGMGNIGKLVSKMACGLGMRIVAYSRSATPGETCDGVLMLKSADEVFCRADFVSLHVPLTTETKYSIGKQQFALMKPTAYFINTSRGAVVVEEDLIQVLREGKIKGAAIDVFEHEPPKSDNPLLHMKNVIVTPHYASSTDRAERLCIEHAVLGVGQILRQENPTWPLNEPDKERHLKRFM